MSNEVNPHAWDQILDRFQNPEGMKALLLARKKTDAYPAEFCAVVMDICRSQFGGDRGKTATFCGIHRASVKNMWLKEQKALANEQATAPLDKFLKDHVADSIPELKQALQAAVRSLPEKLKAASLGDTLKYIPQVTKLIQQLEAGVLPGDIEVQGKPKGPKPVERPIVEELTEDADPDAILAKAEARMRGEAAN